MRVDIAQLPEPPNGQDRVHTAPNAVIVLDGATAFTPVPVDAGTYADELGGRIAAHLTDRPSAGLVDVLASAVGGARDHLGLFSSGRSPSSTVSIVRVDGAHVDVLVLGDSPVIVGHIDQELEVLVDDRLARLPNPHRAAWRRRLSDHHGYDEQHRAILREMQTVQSSQRNRAGGYFIAEADPGAAYQAITRRYSRRHVGWAILATDGAVDLLQHLGLDNWPAIAADPTQASRLLHRASAWEAYADPDGRQLPRAKRHDDKTLAVIRELQTCPPYVLHASD
ncbi:MAG: hypothetical protein M3467_05085 [Actinomycetota bacterium]|nr:hypothetical protein [Actinomycetota bacterium]